MLLWELLGGGQSPAPPKAEGAGGDEGGPVLQDHHIALVEHIHESARLKLRMFYKVGGCGCDEGGMATYIHTYIHTYIVDIFYSCYQDTITCDQDTLFIRTPVNQDILYLDRDTLSH